jgi:hypothetical protein
MIRPDMGQIRKLTVGELKAFPIRPKEERIEFVKQFASDLNRQLVDHGDLRLANPKAAAREFALNTLERIEEAEKVSDNPTAALLWEHGIDESSLDSSMTMEDLGFLTVFATRLKLLGARLRPPKVLSVRDLGMDDLPSWLIYRELMRLHSREHRIKGSNMGDSEIAGIALYADTCVVDKRTHNHLNQSRKRIPALGKRIDRFKKASNYRHLPDCVADFRSPT